MKIIRKNINAPDMGVLLIKILTNTEDDQAYFVGGCVRDSLLGIEPKDWDIATNKTPEKIIELLEYALDKKYSKIFKDDSKFGVIRVVFDMSTHKEEYEIVTFRGDGDYLDNRRPDSVYFSDIETDSKRRDFTINSLYYDPLKSEIIDFNNGIEDLNNKILKTVGVTLDRFEEDYLRILRAIRFAIKLDLTLSNEIKLAIGFLDKWNLYVSNERKLIEFNKTFSYINQNTSNENLTILKYLLKEYFNTLFNYFTGDFNCLEGSNFTLILSSLISTDKPLKNGLILSRLPKKEINKILIYNKILNNPNYLKDNVLNGKKEIESLGLTKNQILTDFLFIKKIISGRIGYNTNRWIQNIKLFLKFELKINSDKYIENGLTGEEIKNAMVSDANVLFKNFLENNE